MRLTAKIVLALVCLLFANAANAVTDAAPHGAAGTKDEWVTTGAATRARADVQIRRIRSLLVSKNGDDDTAYRQLETLQKQLRGQN